LIYPDKKTQFITVTIIFRKSAFTQSKHEIILVNYKNHRHINSAA